MAINSSRVVDVSPGYRTTTVDAVVTTAAGEEPLLIVLDDEGKLLAWKWTDQVQAIETTALAFVKDLAAGQWLNARSRMSLELQQDLAPADLQRKWSKLATVSSGFRSIKDAVIASQGGDQQLVLVAVELEDHRQPVRDLRRPWTDHQRRHLPRFRLIRWRIQRKIPLNIAPTSQVFHGWRGSPRLDGSGRRTSRELSA